jgi:hypothetical protein
VVGFVFLSLFAVMKGEESRMNCMLEKLKKYYQRIEHKTLFIVSFSVAVLTLTMAIAYNAYATGIDENFTFEWITYPENYRVSGFYEGRIWAQEYEKGPWKLYDGNGKVISSDFNADDVYHFEDGVSKYGFFEPFKGGKYSIIPRGGYNYGFVNLSGDVIIEAKKGKINKVINKSGDVTIVATENLAGNIDTSASYGEGLISGVDTKTWLEGYVNLDGTWVILPSYLDTQCAFKDGYAKVLMTNKKWGVIDKKGNVVIPAEYKTSDYNKIGSWSEGRFAIKKNGKWGYAKEGGDIVVNCIFDEVEPFYHGSAIVVLNSKCGLIDRDGNFLVEPIYDNYVSTSSNLIAVFSDDKIGFIDRKGNVAIDFKFNLIKDKRLSGYEMGRPQMGGTYSFDDDINDRAVVIL